MDFSYAPVHFPNAAGSARTVFVDCETDAKTQRLLDFGGIDSMEQRVHTSKPEVIRTFCSKARFVCGHNIAAHDARFLTPIIGDIRDRLIDTLALSALLFPQKRFHALLKDEKLQTTERNNPLTDAIKAKDLFAAETAAFAELSDNLQSILCSLLRHDAHFTGFFDFVGVMPLNGSVATLSEAIAREFKDEICAHADLTNLIIEHPVELGFVLAFLAAKDKAELLPAWTLRNFPETDTVLSKLRDTPCREGCAWCARMLNATWGLKHFFGFEAFRTYDGEPLQERAAQAALNNESLLAVFPTGGGKSITFQIPALMQGLSTKSLTVVLSPLQSLMKDQVDHLVEKGIEGAFTINGMMSPIERARAFEAIHSGEAKILYISPEQLRSKTIEKALMSRRIARFVIDEAHCFSAWGHDFRVDYLYIGDFIAKLQDLQGLKRAIPVSCFTATAKQKVVTDICDYFHKKLGIELKLFTTQAARQNLHYKVIHVEDEAQKYAYIRNLVAAKHCPTIVYVSHTKTTQEIADRLSQDGFAALPYHGKMEASDKIQNQEAFLAGEVNIIVATNAFGMGVDKKDVGLVIHHDISASLENYVQEAGRAGRDPELQAECYVLFNEDDLDGHFAMLTQTKLSQADIQMVWKGIKNLTKSQSTIAASPLELAREAGWDIQTEDLDTRIKTALAALESAGYIQRGRNVPRVYASSIAVDNFEQAKARIEASPVFVNDKEKVDAERIIRSLISERSRKSGVPATDAESRVDYLADRLGLTVATVVESVTLLRIAGVLNDEADMTATFEKNANGRRSLKKVTETLALEKFLLEFIAEEPEKFDVNLKALNSQALSGQIANSSVKLISSLLRALKRSGSIRRVHQIPNTPVVHIQKGATFDACLQRLSTKAALAGFIIDKLLKDADRQTQAVAANLDIQNEDKAHKPVPRISAAFSTVGLLKAWKKDLFLVKSCGPISIRDVEDTLLWLTDIGVLRLQGGFMVLYQGLTIARREINNKRQYRAEDYKQLDNYYQLKLQQIHIVGEYANLMMKDYDKALSYVHDYFALDYDVFLKKYFAQDERAKLKRNMTSKLFDKLFKSLSPRQFEIINDASRFIVVSAGPGSGKTRVLVHKLAALLTLEDVRPEQLLMLTFSRAAATEFKKRLIDLIGKKAYYVDIKTFHSYAFDVLGELGTLAAASDVVKRATDMIASGEVVSGRIAKTTLVIDEAQDMDAEEFGLVQALIDYNETMRVIAVGDDDQNIYAFRGSDSKHLRELITKYDALYYEMVDNWRSCREVVSLANAFAKTIAGRMKHFDGICARDAEGQAVIVKHTQSDFEAAVADDVIARFKEDKLTGSTAVLTGTNDEAYRIAGLLKDNGMRAQLIQDQKEAQIANFVEVRALLKFLRRTTISGAWMSPETWQKGKTYLTDTYGQSSWLDNILRLMQKFESICPKDKMYLSDFEEFVSDSKLEDTYSTANGAVTVSTIHKAKGREFDSVFLLVNQEGLITDEKRRALYVGLTRAKDLLSVHVKGSVFDKLNVDGVEMRVDDAVYPKPKSITLALGHEDVWLDFFIPRKTLIFSLRSSQELQLEKQGLAAVVNGTPVTIVRYSKAFLEKLENWRKAGYEPVSAVINCIVAWKKMDDEEEYPIVLPQIRLELGP